MSARFASAARSATVPALPMDALLLQVDELEHGLRELSVRAAGYRALPAPDALRSYNLEPLASACESAATQALLDFHARDDGYRLRNNFALCLYAQDLVPVSLPMENP